MPQHKRIAVIDRELCNPRVCGHYLCQRVCPVNRSKKECITVSDDDKKPHIDESLCIGCGICVMKCPRKAISVVNLPEKLDEPPMHRYGRNGFSLFRLPFPRKGSVTALIGPNGVGKSTVMNILSGNMKPNSGDISAGTGWEQIISRFKGTELQDYMSALSRKGIRASYKPQHVDLIPGMYKGRVHKTLEKMAPKKRVKEVAASLGIEEMMNKEIADLSGGELQMFAIAGAFLKGADFYFFDEPSSYLDVRERLRAAREIRKLTESAVVMVVEHDLAVADYLADNTHILYGKPGVFGIVSVPYGVRTGINTFLEGYIREENVRFREEPIHFSKTAKPSMKGEVIMEFPAMEKRFGRSFRLKTEPGKLHKGEIVGILGPNAIGKTTFIRMLTGDIEPDSKDVPGTKDLELSYKPQRLVMEKANETMLVLDFLKAASGKKSLAKEDKRVMRNLGLEKLAEKTMKNLSGGELQACFIAAALIKECDIMLLDEPSAFLDAEQRLNAARLIKERAEGREMPCFVVDHDLQFIDAVSDRVIVFSGEKGVEGEASSPTSLRDGMNSFLKSLDITFRRDPLTGRPRANKPDSQKDKEQRDKGEYYYA